MAFSNINSSGQSPLSKAAFILKNSSSAKCSLTAVAIGIIFVAGMAVAAWHVYGLTTKLHLFGFIWLVILSGIGTIGTIISSCFLCCSVDGENYRINRNANPRPDPFMEEIAAETESMSENKEEFPAIIPEMKYEIFKRLPTYDLSQAALVSKTFVSYCVKIMIARAQEYGYQITTFADAQKSLASLFNSIAYLVDQNKIPQKSLVYNGYHPFRYVDYEKTFISCRAQKPELRDELNTGLITYFNDNKEHSYYLCKQKRKVQGNELAQAFLALGADPNTSIDGKLPLIEMVRWGRVQEVKNLIALSAIVDAEDKNGYTALFLAVYNRNQQLIDILLQAKANPNLITKNTLVLHLALNRSNTLGIIRALLNAGADPNLVDSNGDLPLQIAVDRKCPEFVELLLENRAEVNALDTRGISALQRLFCHKEINLQILKALLEKGADTNVQSEKADPLLHVAVELNRPDIVTLLLAKGANINAVDKQGMTALQRFFCYKNRNLQILEALLKKGADPNIQSEKKGPLLHYASHEATSLLIDYKAHVDALDKEGHSALYAAIQKNAVEAEALEKVKVLLQAGANPNLAKEGTHLPLELAIEKRFISVILRLLDEGANPELLSEAALEAAKQSREISFLLRLTK